MDVALLLPEEIADLAIELNRSFLGSETNKIILGKKEGEAMPHSSLNMGCVEESELPKLIEILSGIGKHFSSLDLEFYGIDTEKIRVDTIVSSLGIKKGEELRTFHEEVMNKLKAIFSRDASREMFFSPPPVSLEEFSYINKFYEMAAFEKFYPHVTLGLGEIRDSKIKFPIKFKASTLAVCHLGDYYTCRKILWSMKF